MPRKNKRWTDHEKKQLAELYPSTPVAELAKKFGCSVGTVYVLAGVLGASKRKQRANNRWSVAKEKRFIKLYPKRSISRLIEIFGGTRASIASKACSLKLRKKNVHHWTPAEIEMLRELYPDTSNPEIGKIFKVTESKISNLAHRLKLRKSEAFMADPANRSCFPKGHVPKNKGKKQVNYMSAEQISRTASTRFKKGQLPPNTLHDGVITVRHGHKKRGARPYKHIRIGLAKWKMLHVYMWEQANGPVPSGHIIVFRDKDSMNCELENLEMISRAEHARRNHNKEKAANTIRNLSDKFVAGRIAMGNKRLRKKLIKEPELLDVARQNMFLKRQTKKTNKQ